MERSVISTHTGDIPANREVFPEDSCLAQRIVCDVIGLRDVSVVWFVHRLLNPTMDGPVCLQYSLSVFPSMGFKILGTVYSSWPVVRSGQRLLWVAELCTTGTEVLHCMRIVPYSGEALSVLEENISVGAYRVQRSPNAEAFWRRYETALVTFTDEHERVEWFTQRLRSTVATWSQADISALRAKLGGDARLLPALQGVVAGRTPTVRVGAEMTFEDCVGPARGVLPGARLMIEADQGVVTDPFLDAVNVNHAVGRLIPTLDGSLKAATAYALLQAKNRPGSHLSVGIPKSWTPWTSFGPLQQFQGLTDHDDVYTDDMPFKQFVKSSLIGTVVVAGYDFMELNVEDEHNEFIILRQGCVSRSKRGVDTTVYIVLNDTLAAMPTTGISIPTDEGVPGELADERVYDPLPGAGWRVRSHVDRPGGGIRHFVRDYSDRRVLKWDDLRWVGFKRDVLVRVGQYRVVRLRSKGKLTVGRNPSSQSGGGGGGEDLGGRLGAVPADVLALCPASIDGSETRYIGAGPLGVFAGDDIHQLSSTIGEGGVVLTTNVANEAISVSVLRRGLESTVNDVPKISSIMFLIRQVYRDKPTLQSVTLSSLQAFLEFYAMAYFKKLQMAEILNRRRQGILLRQIKRESRAWWNPVNVWSYSIDPLVDWLSSTNLPRAPVLRIDPVPSVCRGMTPMKIGDGVIFGGGGRGGQAIAPIGDLEGQKLAFREYVRTRNEELATTGEALSVAAMIHGTRESVSDKRCGMPSFNVFPLANHFTEVPFFSSKCEYELLNGFMGRQVQNAGLVHRKTSMTEMIDVLDDLLRGAYPQFYSCGAGDFLSGLKEGYTEVQTLPEWSRRTQSAAIEKITTAFAQRETAGASRISTFTRVFGKVEPGNADKPQRIISNRNPLMQSTLLSLGHLMRFFGKHLTIFAPGKHYGPEMFGPFQDFVDENSDPYAARGDFSRMDSCVAQEFKEKFGATLLDNWMPMVRTAYDLVVKEEIMTELKAMGFSTVSVAQHFATVYGTMFSGDWITTLFQTFQTIGTFLVAARRAGIDPADTPALLVGGDDLSTFAGPETLSAIIAEWIPFCGEVGLKLDVEYGSLYGPIDQRPTFYSRFFGLDCGKLIFYRKPARVLMRLPFTTKQYARADHTAPVNVSLLVAKVLSEVATGALGIPVVTGYIQGLLERPDVAKKIAKLRARNFTDLKLDSEEAVKVLTSQRTFTSLEVELRAKELNTLVGIFGSQNALTTICVGGKQRWLDEAQKALTRVDFNTRPTPGAREDMFRLAGMSPASQILLEHQLRDHAGSITPKEPFNVAHLGCLFCPEGR